MYKYLSIPKVLVFLTTLSLCSPCLADSSAQESSLDEQKIVALLIGQDSYADTPLIHATTEIEQISAVLGNAGAEIVKMTDPDLSSMRKGLREFAQKINSPNVISFIYFVGHAVQYKDINYLLPASAKIPSQEEIPEFTLNFNSVLEYLDNAQNKANIIILNTSYRSLNNKQLSTENTGLTAVDGPAGSLIIFSTPPGTEIDIPNTTLSPFGRSLIQHLKNKALDIEQVAKNVRIDLIDLRDQNIWQSASLRDDIYLFPSTYRKQSDVKDQIPGKDLKAWLKISERSEITVFKNFLHDYPNSNYANLAQIKINRLITEQTSQDTETISASEEAEANIVLLKGLLKKPNLRQEELKQSAVYLGLLRSVHKIEASTYDLLLNKTLKHYHALIEENFRNKNYSKAKSLAEGALKLSPETEQFEDYLEKAEDLLNPGWF